MFISDRLPLQQQFNPGILSKEGSEESVTLPKDSVQPGEILSSAPDDTSADLQAMARKAQARKPVMGERYHSATTTGDIRLHRNFHSDILKHDRDVFVMLPPGYNPDDAKRYPILYLNDGQNMFDAATAFGGQEWHVDEIANYLMRSGKMEEIIIVGVSNSPDRMNEYTPVGDTRRRFGGDGELYARFLETELMPYMNEAYKTQPGVRTGIAGSSLGGEEALAAGLLYSSAFSCVGALSPSIWFAGKAITSMVANSDLSGKDVKVYMNTGWNEEGVDENPKNGWDDNIDNSREFGEMLLKKGFRQGETLFYNEDHNGGHNEASWANQMPDLLMKLYPPRG